MSSGTAGARQSHQAGPSRQQPPPMLRERVLRTWHLAFFQVAASSPLTTLAGGVVTTLALTGNRGAVIAFVLVGVVCWLAAEGFGAMARFVSNAGAFYAYVTRGLGVPAGVAAAGVGVVAYNAIQVSLYGLFGAALSDLAATSFGVLLPWWAWALLAVGMVGALGAARVALGAAVVAVALLVEGLVVVLFVAAAVASPGPGGLSPVGWSPVELFTGPSVGAVLALTVAAFVGFESGVVYSEEVTDPRRTVPRAMRVGVAVIAIGYAVAAWALIVEVGPAGVRDAAAQAGPGLVFGILARTYGDAVGVGATVVLLGSIAAAMLAFHGVVARYLFALARERVLPARLDRVSPRSGAPLAGSWTQTTIAAATVAVFALAGGDPVLQLFAWLSGTAALGVVALMAATSVAVICFFRGEGRDAEVSTWQRLLAPAAAMIGLAALAGAIVANFGALVGTEDPLVRWGLPGLLAVAALAGALRGLALPRAVAARVGRGVLDPDDFGTTR